MLQLFKFENYKLIVEPEALLLKPFKKIWTRDRSYNKETAMAELGFIYFMSDPRSDYQYLTNPDDREAAIKEGEGLPKKWKPDTVIKEAITFYETFKPTPALLLEDTRLAIDKLRTALRDIDLTQTIRGKPVHSISTIIAAIKQVPALVEELNKAEKAVNSQILEDSRMRGQGEKTLLEDGFNIE